MARGGVSQLRVLSQTGVGVWTRAALEQRKCVKNFKLGACVCVVFELSSSVGTVPRFCAVFGCGFWFLGIYLFSCSRPV